MLNPFELMNLKTIYLVKEKDKIYFSYSEPWQEEGVWIITEDTDLAVIIPYLYNFPEITEPQTLQ